MTTAEVLLGLRQKNELSQEDLAAKLLVTRQAVSHWETGVTTPNTDTLKMISKTFGVSINTLLGQPQALFCQACGMPLQDDLMAREADGGFNEDYCRWCRVDGEYVGAETLAEMIEVCVPHMAMPEEAARPC
jgi:transcriptional regulator with XRE-family HTH domain